MTGESFNIVVQQISTLTLGIIIAFISCWQIALVVLVCVPLLGIGAAMQMKLMTGFAADGARYGLVAAFGLLRGRTLAAGIAVVCMIGRSRDTSRHMVDPLYPRRALDFFPLQDVCCRRPSGL